MTTQGEDMSDHGTYFLTWTTYGSWLPGDARGWRKVEGGEQRPQPLLEAWCRDRMRDPSVILNAEQRERVERVCIEHARIRGWWLHAVSVRSNHVHVVVTADRPPRIVRDQFKANATRVLRAEPDALHAERVWTRGGDCRIIDGESSLDAVVRYVLEAQDRKDRDLVDRSHRMDSGQRTDSDHDP